MDDEDPYAHFVLSLVLLWRREHDRALAEVQRCLALAPSSAEGHLQLASTQYYCGDPAGSLETIKAYMRLDPLYPEFALYFLAQAQHSLGQFDAAVATLKRRLERNPRSETTYALLASCYGHLVPNYRKPVGLGGGHENRSGFFSRATVAHHAVPESR